MDRVDPIVEQAADRLRELEPSAVAVVVTGSYARGTADEHSDLDVRAITEGEPHIGYRTPLCEEGRGAHALPPDRAERPIVVHSPREALDGALSFSVAPEHYRDDLAVCLGLTASSVEEVERAAQRLTSELLAFLRERKPDVDPQPDLARYLADGTLERHLGFASG